MRGGSGRPARIKSRNMKKLLFTLLFCAAAAAAAGSEPAELKLLSYNIRYIGAPGDEGDFAWDCLLYTSPSPRDYAASRMPSSA